MEDEIERTLLWDDNPSAVDLLGFDDLAAPIVETLGQAHLDPVCIGVFGPWGSGKTSVLNLVERRLEADSATLVVYTQPWSYDPTTDPKATLVGEVLNAVRGSLDEPALDRLRDRLKGLAKRVRWSRAVKLAARTALTAQLPGMDDIEGLFGQDDQVSEPTLQGFRSEFAELLDDEAFSDLTRVVVVVDDLDRCLPPTVVDTLEAIKLFLAVPKMAFVLAADEGPVAHAIASTFGHDRDGVDLARRYLEKIVQIPVRVPSLGRSDTEAYIAQLMLQHRIADTDAFEVVRQQCALRRSRGETSLLDGVADEVADSERDLHLAARLAPILYEELAGNPRRIKRLLNALWIRSDVAGRRGLLLDFPALAKLVVLEEVFPADFRTLLSWLSDGSLDERLRQLEAGEGEFTASLRRWGQLEPQLAELGVGSYLVLAAALQGTIVTVDSLPAHLRELADELTSAAAATRRQAQRRIHDDPPSVEDRSSLAVHLAEAVRFQPSRQAELSESLTAVVGDSDEVASAACGALRRMPPSAVEPALIVQLAPPDTTPHPSIASLLETWVDSDDLDTDTRRAADLARAGT